MDALRSLCEVPVPSVTHFVPCGGGKHARQTAGGRLPSVSSASPWSPPAAAVCMGTGRRVSSAQMRALSTDPKASAAGTGFCRVRTLVSEDEGDEAFIHADPELVLSVIRSCSDGLASRRGRCCSQVAGSCLPEPSPSEGPRLHQRHRSLRSSAQAWGPGPHPALLGFESDRGLGT